MNQPDKIEVMKPESIIRIDFKPDFYRRLVYLFESIIKDKTQDELMSASKQIQDNEIVDTWVINYHTVSYLIKASEDYVQANNLTEFVNRSELSEKPL